MRTTDRFVRQLAHVDPDLTEEWLESLDNAHSVLGDALTGLLLQRLLERARDIGVHVARAVSTPYVNTIPSSQEATFPGDEAMERRIRRFVRWNAAAMVVRANKTADGIGGHLATYASSATLYEVGFNHFFQGSDGPGAGDQVFFQGHAAPGVYARAFLEGRVTEQQLDRFRREVAGGGLSSYPHPRTMPEFWQFPTVSMGLGPLNAIYQARFNRYLQNRGIGDTSRSRVWCFVGDGEMDEPESLAGLALAGRERLDNLTFVVNCNLQRLDGPVRGNGKIVQELEQLYRGAGWNVIKVVWNRQWDPLLASDTHGALLGLLNETVDGEFQRLSTQPASGFREDFFGRDPAVASLVAHWSDTELSQLGRGGHDYAKVYNAYRAAAECKGQPTVILAKTVKGWTLGPDIEGRNATHQIKKMTQSQLLALRDRLHLDDVISDDDVADGMPPYRRLPVGGPEEHYLQERRRALGGPLPRRRASPKPLQPAGDHVAEFAGGSGDLEVSTTMAFARMLRGLMRDEALGERVVPIVPDEARTFGMDALFSEFEIYAPHGQQYRPVDADLMLSYKEGVGGQVLEEGITEAGSMASFTAAGTSYATHGEPLLPFFTFYSMFGFQRVGDMVWAFGDMRGRGFLCGATAGRTTLHGEGLQHDDGHSLVLASTIPNVMAYDPAFAYEVAVIVDDGIRRMWGPDAEDVFYYVALYNEPHKMPPMPAATQQGIVEGLYQYAPRSHDCATAATILFSGSANQAAIEAKRLLESDWNVAVDLWSATSYKRLREEALEAERWNRLHPELEPRVPRVTGLLRGSVHEPVVAVTDFMRSVPDQISRWVDRPWVSLGTDGYGLSDTREALRRHFEVDVGHTVVAVLAELATLGVIDRSRVAKAVTEFDIDTEAASPWTP